MSYIFSYALFRRLISGLKTNLSVESWILTGNSSHSLVPITKGDPSNIGLFLAGNLKTILHALLVTLLGTRRKV